MKIEFLKEFAELIQDLPTDISRITALSGTVERANATVRDYAECLAVDAAPTDFIQVLLRERDTT